MSERTYKSLAMEGLCMGLIVFSLIFGVYSFGRMRGRAQGRAEQKHWDEVWYAAHPVVTEVPDYDSLPLGKQIHDCLSAGKTWVTRERGTFFTVGCDIDVWDPPPLPKPQKGSKRQKGDIAVIGDHLAPSCKHFPTYDECQYEIVARPVETKP